MTLRLLSSVALFAVWAIVGFIESFAVLYFFVLAPAFALINWLVYRCLPKASGSRMPEAFGLLAGFGAFWLFIAGVAYGDASAEATIGALAVGASLAGYLMLGHRRCHRLATN
jgi:hypothetical protein